MAYRWWLLPLVVLAVLAFFVAVYYPVARVQYRETRQRTLLQAELDATRARNDRLRTAVDRLRTPEGVEDYARLQLGLVKKGEHQVVVVDGSEPVPDPDFADHPGYRLAVGPEAAGRTVDGLPRRGLRRAVSSPEQPAVPTGPESALVAEQVGRPPRTPWRVAARCRYGRPTVIVSPSRLDDGTPFPTYAWLTCPHLVERVGAAESAGAVARFAERAAREPVLSADLGALDARLRALRTAESGGTDACAAVGIGGQRDPLGVKCLHLHVALALLGERDPIGIELLGQMPRECENDRCGALAGADAAEEGS